MRPIRTFSGALAVVFGALMVAKSSSLFAAELAASKMITVACPAVWPRGEFPGPKLSNVEIFTHFNSIIMPPDDGIYNFPNPPEVPIQMDCQYSRAQGNSRHIERRTVVIALPETVVRCYSPKPFQKDVANRVCEIIANPDGTIGPIMHYVTEPVNFAVALWGVRIKMTRDEARAAFIAQGIKPEDIADLGADGLRVPLAQENGFVRVHFHPVRRTVSEVAWHTPFSYDDTRRWLALRFGLARSWRYPAIPRSANNPATAEYWPSVKDPVEVEYLYEFEGEPQRVRLIDLSDLSPEERARRR